ncbi:methylated-DNA--[protein]-cysteine S-methyltransferase [Candidatus Micrarchaeota archaeon]|nr:methylated-DNA--[protein]-cysteine S-methyltransferase [Candidatus Micrarchaeota archaeon]
MAGEFEENVFSACAQIERGRVSTYMDIAKAIGRPGAARAVGNVLNKNRKKSVPCHRVVRSEGRVGGFAKGGRERQRMLGKEGIETRKGRIVDFGGRFRRLRCIFK